MTPHQSPERRRRLPNSLAAASRAPVDGAAMLPMELIFEILSRVPVRSVCRFRCVSKGWQALLHDPIFVAAHKSLNAETFIVVSSLPKVPDGDRELRLMDMDGNDVKVIKGIPCSGLLSASMDDLVCVRDGSIDGPCVINPATGKVLVDCPKHGVRSLEAWNFVFGFGRAIPSGTYKVVRFSDDRSCEVFSLGDSTGWRRSECPPADFFFVRSSVVAVKGVMYFLASRNKYADTLLCFDIESEEWTKTIGSPKEVLQQYTRNSWSNTIAELNDTVCMVQPMERVTSYIWVNIWLLQDSHQDTWIKAFTIRISEFTYRYKPLRVTPDGGKLILYSTVFGEGHALQVYDLHTETCTTLRRLDYVTSISLCSLFGQPLSQPRS
ncbi:hypothetical protein ACQ4PT_012010 [Festuca glaucescens]